MPQRKYLGLADELHTVTYGEPGKRTFNINVASRHGSGTVWLEKEQLYSIAESLGSALSILDEIPEPASDADDIFQSEPDQEPDQHIEFKAWQIALQFDERRKIFIFAAAGPDPEADQDQASQDAEAFMIHFGFSCRQARELAVEGMEIVAAGRPICTYCGNSIDEPENHQCHRRNGHDVEDARKVLDALEEYEEEQED